MLSLALEDFLINSKYHTLEIKFVRNFDSWTDIRQEYLDNNNGEKVTLCSCIKYFDETAKFIGPCLSIIYNGTDKDFAKKYISYIQNWNEELREQCMIDMINSQNIAEDLAEDYSYDIENIMKLKNNPSELTELQEYIK